MRLASMSVWEDLVAHGHKQLDQALRLVGFVAEQKLLGGMPTPMLRPVDADPLEAAAWHGDLERGDRKAQLMFLDSLAKVAHHVRGLQDALSRLQAARAALGARVPAVEAALRAYTADKKRKLGVGPDGRPGTSGVSYQEAKRVKEGAVRADSACLVCQLAASEVGRLKGMLCNTHYQAWWRDGKPERQPWVLEARRALAGSDDALAEVLSLDAYRDNLKDVA